MENFKIFKNYFLLSLFYIFLFFLINIIHFYFLPAKVILYSLLIDLVITLCLFIIFLILINKKYYFYKNFLVTIFFLIAITQTMVIYSILIPTVVDRSLSIYLLKHLDNSNGTLAITEFKKIAQYDYFDEMRVVETRINEQLATGSIMIINNNIILTDKGKKLIKIFSFIKSYLLPKVHKDIHASNFN